VDLGGSKEAQVQFYLSGCTNVPCLQAHISFNLICCGCRHMHRKKAMMDKCIVSEIVTKFLLDTCRVRPKLTLKAVQAAETCAIDVAVYPKRRSLITGSVAEFYIEPMLPHVGDIDVMYHRTTVLAIPLGHPPPTQLPAEFDNSLNVYEIINDDDFAGYVYLELWYRGTKCTEDKYSYTDAEGNLYSLSYATTAIDRHGPAVRFPVRNGGEDVLLPIDNVPCVRCLSWPSQAADWPTRHRNYDWPDSVTVYLVVSNGCDMVHVAHRQCRQVEWMGKYQWRLSFSRAEIVLINSWMPVQQIVYHMLRVFVKTELLKDSDVSEALSNYHIKTLMMWACELKSSSFWTDDLNLIRICVKLLHTLSVWLSDARCKHYFIKNWNLIDNFFCMELEDIACRLQSIDEEWLADWFVNNYIRKCSCSLFSSNTVSSLFRDASTNTKLQKAVSALVHDRLNSALADTWGALLSGEMSIPQRVSDFSLTAQSCVYWLTDLAKTGPYLPVYFTAVAFLHVAYKISRIGFTDELIDVLATIAGKQRVTLRAANMNTPDLVQLLQQCAVKHLTTFLQLKAKDFPSLFTTVTTDFEALYAYKHGDYQRCLQLSTHNTHALLCDAVYPSIRTFPEFIQLLDDDIVSLTALTLIVNPECRVWPDNVLFSQLTLSLYLTTQCQLKLRHSVTSLAQTLDYIKVAQRRIKPHCTLDLLVLKLLKTKACFVVHRHSVEACDYRNVGDMIAA